MSTRVQVAREVLEWAEKRSRRKDIRSRIPHFHEWLGGQRQPTLKQLEELAKVTHTPIGYLFLRKPPAERLPLPDFRTIRDATIEDPSADLLDTIYLCQRRQEWYREYAQSHEIPKSPIVGMLKPRADVTVAANRLRDALKFSRERRGSNWSEAFRLLRREAERSGVLVMVSGVVANNPHRKLDPKEFRGFVLADQLAPLIFVNGADTKAAQIFTLVHELAHIAVGESAVSDADMLSGSEENREQWCNSVAAEFLVPKSELESELDRLVSDKGDLTRTLDVMASHFKVSTLVVLRRLFEIGSISEADYRKKFAAELERVQAFLKERDDGRGDFYNTQAARLGERFERALIESTLEGRTLYREAFQLLGIRSVSTFNRIAEELGVA